MIGRDLEERRRLFSIIAQAAQWSVLVVIVLGPGIPEADRGHAVERFVRLEASRTQPGSGLGLSLASAVATLRGGALKLADAQPGLRATLALPAVAGVAVQKLASSLPLDHQETF